MTQKQINVTYADKKIEDEFELLKSGKFQDKQLYKFIERAKQDLKTGQNCGVKIQKRLWPKAYIQKYNITNLWKYDLPNGWRLIYTIKVNDVMILNVILEWFSHKEYEKRFKY
jgi:hypothetical protein